MRLLSLLQSFNPHWEGRDLAEWAWPRRRVFARLAKVLEGPLSLGIAGTT